jgi:hypothetical protein
MSLSLTVPRTWGSATAQPQNSSSSSASDRDGWCCRRLLCGACAGALLLGYIDRVLLRAVLVLLQATARRAAASRQRLAAAVCVCFEVWVALCRLKTAQENTIDTGISVLQLVGVLLGSTRAAAQTRFRRGTNGGGCDVCG